MRARIVGRAGSVSTPRRVVEAEELGVYEFRLGMWLSTHTAEFCSNVSQREMARRLRMSNGVTERALASLEKLGIVTVDKAGKGQPVSVLFNVEVWESLGEVTGRRSLVTGSWSLSDRETVTKDLQGESQESRSSPPPRKEHQSDAVWDAVTEYVGPVATRGETSRRGKVVKQLKEVGATAADIQARCREYRRKWPRVDLTDTALVSHWSSLVPKREEQVVLNGAVMDPMTPW